MPLVPELLLPLSALSTTLLPETWVPWCGIDSTFSKTDLPYYFGFDKLVTVVLSSSAGEW